MKKAFAFVAILACGGEETRVQVPPPAATCMPNDLDGEPLVVDLRAEKRAELEAALSHGIVAVRYDCSGVHVLRDCVAKGDYAFSGVTEKEELVRFATPSELRANFPTNGESMARDHAGSEIALALAIVGTRAAQRVGLHASDFAGTCAGATHYVQRATVGAFGLRFVQRGAKADVASVVASGDARDGSLETCRTSARRASSS